VCELFDENAPNWSNVVVGYLLPVEPRGVSSVVMMIGLIAAGALVIQVRGCATPQPGNQSPASQTAPADG